MGQYIYTEFSKKLLCYYFIDLFYILNRPNLGPKKFINLWCFLIYRISTVHSLHILEW